MTKKQRMLIELYATKPFAKDKDIAAEVGVTVQYISNLKRKKEFREGVEERLREIWKDSTRLAVDTMIELVKGGDREAAKFVLQANGYGPDNKMDVNVSTPETIKITITDD